MTPEELDATMRAVETALEEAKNHLDDCLFLDPDTIEGFHRAATSAQLLEEFKGTQGPVLVIAFTPDEKKIQWLTNATPGDALALASQFINVMSNDGDRG